MARTSGSVRGAAEKSPRLLDRPECAICRPSNTPPPQTCEACGLGAAALKAGL